MTTESLVVKLKGDTSSLDKSLSKTNKNLNELDGNVSKSDKSLASMTKGAAVAGNAVLELSKAAIAVGVALTTMITLTAKGEQELQVFAKTARTTTSDFEALAFATKQIGLDAKGTADAMNDVNERLAEFGVGDGAGAFDDFAMAMGLSKDEAKAVAAELKELSGEDALRELVNQMEAAETSTADMNFVLKSLSNDLAYASVLFEDNGKQLDKLKGQYSAVNDELSITQKEAEGLTEAATSFDLLTETLGNSAKVISAQLAPALNEFFNGVIDVVPEATQVIVDFINTFRDAENIENIDSLNRLIDEQTASIDELTQKKNDYVGVAGYNRDADADEIITKARLSGEILTETQRLDELIAKRDEALEQQQTIADAAKGNGGVIGGTIGSNSESTGGSDELQSLLDRFKSEEQLLLEKYETERSIAAGNNDLLLELEREYLENSQLLKDEAAAKDQARLDEQTSYYADILKQQGKIDAENVSAVEKGSKDKSKSEEAYLDAAITTGNALFEDQKAVKAGLVVVDTAAGISKAFAELPYPAALAASASIAATGVAQLAAITSASKGGSSTSSAVPAESLPDEVPELEAQNSDLNGSNQTVTIRFDDSTELGVAFNNAIERSRQDGLI